MFDGLDLVFYKLWESLDGYCEGGGGGVGGINKALMGCGEIVSVYKLFGVAGSGTVCSPRSWGFALEYQPTDHPLTFLWLYQGILR